MMTSLKSKLPLVLILCSFIALLTYLYWPQAKPEQKQKNVQSIKVDVTRVKQQTFKDVIEALGTTKANEAVTIYPQYAGRVRQLHFNDGDIVVKGQKLVSFVSDEEQAEVNELEANLQEAQAQLTRLNDLTKTNAISDSVLDEQSAEVHSIIAQLDKANAKLAKYEITAPFAGLLGLREISLGALLSNNDPITTLDDIRMVKVDFTIPERELTQIKIGQQIEATNIAYTDLLFKGRIISIDSRLDPVTRSINVRAQIDNHDFKLRPGMLMNIMIEKSSEQLILIPESALIPIADRQFVYIVTETNGGDENSKQLTANKKLVNIGRRRPGVVEIINGVTVGDLVVVAGTMKLRDGKKVTINQELN